MLIFIGILIKGESSLRKTSNGGPKDIFELSQQNLILGTK